MHQTATKLVPHLLSEVQQNHVNTCQDLESGLERDPEFFLKKITGDRV
jgi:hypothetical protein